MRRLSVVVLMFMFGSACGGSEDTATSDDRPDLPTVADCGPGEIHAAGDVTRCVTRDTTEAPAATPPSSTTTTTLPTTTTTMYHFPTYSYEVVGTGRAMVTYFVSGYSQAQEEVSLPWRHDLPQVGGPTFRSVLAQLQDTGTVTCRILSDGAVIEEVTSSGPYVIAHCTDD